MADVTSLLPQLRVSNSYTPICPPKAPKATSSYARSLQDAPYTALSGVVKDGRIPERHPVFPRCRERHQVGSTNRWRLPESLYSDLLGNAQALKAINMPYNNSMVRIITGMHPQPPQPPSLIPWAIPPPSLRPDPADPTQSGYMEIITEAAAAYVNINQKLGDKESCVTLKKS